MPSSKNLLMDMEMKLGITAKTKPRSAIIVMLLLSMNSTLAVEFAKTPLLKRDVHYKKLVSIMEHLRLVVRLKALGIL